MAPSAPALKVFVTGGTGFIGSRVVKALIADGHSVTALSRRQGTNLEKLSVKTVQGTLRDLDIITNTAAEADAVLHLAFEHDFSNYRQSVEQDLAAIKAIGAALAGSGKLFATTSTTSGIADTGDEIAEGIQPVVCPRGPAEAATLAVSMSAAHEAVLSPAWICTVNRFLMWYCADML